jgi:hypothetical protein
MGPLQYPEMGSGTGELSPQARVRRRSVLAGLVRRAITRLRPAGVVLFIAGMLALIPYPTCLLRLFAGIPCPACGLTRAGLSILNGDISRATEWHPLSPLLVIVFIASVCVALLGSDATWQKFARIASFGSAIALVGVWVLRFWGAFGGPVP